MVNFSIVFYSYKNVSPTFILSFIFRIDIAYRICAKDGSLPKIFLLRVENIGIGERERGALSERRAIFPFPLRSTRSLRDSLRLLRGTPILGLRIAVLSGDSFPAVTRFSLVVRESGGPVRTEFGCHKYANVRGEPTGMCQEMPWPFNSEIDALRAKRCSLRDASARELTDFRSCCVNYE